MGSLSIILAVDVGSSSVRCTSYEFSCRSESEGVSAASHPIRALEGMNRSIPMTSVSPNTGFIRINEVLNAIDTCVNEVLCLLRQTMTKSYNIAALGFSTFVMNLVGVDEFGHPVGDEATMSYACNRSEVLDICARIEKSLSADAKQTLYQQTGAPIHPAYALPQILTFYNTKDSHNADLVEKVRKWKTISSICLSRWTGRDHNQIPISYSEASWTGMLNYSSCTWNDEVMTILGKSCDTSVLPLLSDYDIGDNLGNGLNEYSYDGSINIHWDKWPELRKCQFCLGIGDGAAANIGSKCGPSTNENKRRIAVTIGTSAAARLCLPLEVDVSNQFNIVVPFGLFCYRVDKNTILLGGALTDGGSLVEWARTLFGLQSTQSFTECIEKVTALYSSRCDSSSSCITMAPFLSGERSTGFRIGANGCIFGITRETTSIDIMYACLESVVLRLCAIIKLLTSVCSDDECILVASGNALERNDLWRQMTSDCCGLEIVMDGDSNEGTSRGVAISIAKKMFFRNAAEELKILTSAVPDSNKFHLWNKATLAQDDLIGAVGSIWTCNKM